MLKELVKKRAGYMAELIDVTNFGDVIYYFKGNTARKKLNDFENGIELIEEIKSGNKDLEESEKNAKFV